MKVIKLSPGRGTIGRPAVGLKGSAGGLGCSASGSPAVLATVSGEAWCGRDQASNAGWSLDSRRGRAESTISRLDGLCPAVPPGPPRGSSLLSVDSLLVVSAGGRRKEQPAKGERKHREEAHVLTSRPKKSLRHQRVNPCARQRPSVSLKRRRATLLLERRPPPGGRQQTKWKPDE